MIFPDLHYQGMEQTLFQQRIAERLSALNTNAARVSTAIGKNNSFVRDILRKGSVPKGDNLTLLAEALETTADYLLGRTDDPKAVGPARQRTTTIVGRAGASTDGKLVYAEGQGGLGTVYLPEGASSESVAIEIEGYSMGFLADGALIFYSETHSAPTDDMLGLIVIVGLDDGSVLLKKLLRGSEPGFYDLESVNGPMMRDQKVVWAAHIDSIVPPWRAKRLKVEAEGVAT